MRIQAWLLALVASIPPIASAAPPKQVLRSVFASPDVTSEPMSIGQVWTNDIIEKRHDAIFDAILGCHPVDERTSVAVSLTIASDGRASDVDVDLWRDGECAKRAIAAIRFPAFSIPQIKTTMKIQFDPAPIGCDQQWELAPLMRACARGAVVEIVYPSGIEYRVPLARVLDTSGEMLMPGACGFKDVEHAEHKVCILGGQHAHLVYVEPVTTSRAFGAVRVATGDGILATDGRTIDFAHDAPKSDGFPGKADLQQVLVANGVKPATDRCAWTVREPLHRTRANTSRMTFESCAGEAVPVAVSVDDDHRAAQPYHVSRIR
jgi:hypothetical protein